MAKKVYLSQRTKRHVVKRLDASYTYEVSFGTYGVTKTDNTGLNFPWDITKDNSDNIYVCDGNNERIVKFDSDLNYLSEVDVSSEVGKPSTIFFDGTDLYVVGVFGLSLSIARLSTALTILEYDNNIYPYTGEVPKSVTKGFGTDFLISGVGPLLRLTDNFVIDSSNDRFTFEEEYNTKKTVIITKSNYSAVGLASEIQTKLNALGNPSTYVVTYSGVTDKYTISSGQIRVITSGVNDRIDFEETPNSQLTITVPQGSYTPTALATAIQTQLNFIGSSTYTVTVATDRLNISSDLSGGSGVFNILWGTGTNKVASIGNTIGFDIITDDTGNSNYTADKGLFSLLWTYEISAGLGKVLGFDTSSNDTGSLSYTSNFARIFGVASIQAISGESNVRYLGHIKHTDGNLYLVANEENRAYVIKVNSSYVNTGDSNTISKFASYIAESYTGELLIYDNDNSKVLRYDTNLNFVETVYEDTGDTVSTDAHEIYGIVEIDL